MYHNHKLAQKISVWKISVLCTESLAMVSTVFTRHTCAGTGVMPILAFYPTSDFLIHLSLFSKSFYFCTDLETAGKIFLTKILKSQIPIKRKKRGGATSDNPETCNAEFPFNLENWHESLKPPTALKKKNVL